MTARVSGHGAHHRGCGRGQYAYEHAHGNVLKEKIDGPFNKLTLPMIFLLDRLRWLSCEYLRYSFLKGKIIDRG